MHKKSFDPPASEFRQAPSQFIGRGVILVVAAACGFIVTNIYCNQPWRQEGHPMGPQASRRRHRLACGQIGRNFQNPNLQFS